MIEARAASSPTATRDGHTDWAQRYARWLLWTDIVVVFWAVLGSQIAWFGLSVSNVSIVGELDFLALSYTAVSVGLCVAWVVVLSIYATRDARIVGTGTDEYRRIVDASLMLFGLLAIVAYLLQIDLARGYFITALPVGVVALLASRWLWRQYLTGRRYRGGMSAHVLLIGSTVTVLHTAIQLARQPEAGYLVVGACVPGGTIGSTLPGSPVPVVGNVDEVLSAIELTGADTVVVTSSDELPPERMRQLSWSLEPGRQHLVVAPGLTDIAGPRIHTRPVAGLPLVHVETPRYAGGQSALKRIFDALGASVLIAALSPVIAATALGVKLTSPGPVFYRQRRIGLGGASFEMLKFRSMVVDADSQLAGLLTAQGTAGQPLFKIANDPRVTRIGSFIRRFSIDELPQLFNVFAGSMSLVGPRPQVPAEVELYDKAAGRRLNVKPGITGLWQTSGRSNLSWEEAIRLDLYYVENWSLTGDLIILWRTIRAVVSRDGAY